MTSYFPKALESLAEVRVSVRRITDFLLLPELRSIEDDMDENHNVDSDVTKEGSASDVLIEMKDATFSWAIITEEKNEILELSAKEKKQKEDEEKEKTLHGSKDATTSPTDNKDSIHEKHADGSAVGLDTLKKAILSNITMTLRQDDLLAIVGPVGSGKSSFCMALLQEMTLVSGSMELAQRNRSTAQRSITMSYSAQSPWILAGSIRSNILFGSKFDRERYDKVIKACELTRDLSLFPQGDATIIGERGVTLSGGQRARVSLARAAYRKADVYILDDPLSAVDPKVGRALFDNCISGLLKGKARVLVTHQLQYIQDCDNVIVLEHGQITHKGHVDEVMKEEVQVNHLVQEGEVVKSVKTNTQFVNVLREFAKKAITQSDVDDDQSSAVRNNDHNTAVDVKDEGARVADKEDDGDSIMEKNLTTEEVAEGDTSLRAYVEFFRIGSTWAKLVFTLVCLTAAQGIMVGGEFFLSEWSSQSAAEQKRSYYPAAFGLFCLGTVIMTLFRSFLFIGCLTASSRNMFRTMLDAIMRTNIDFFHANPHGRILNRFSKDMANCDELLPYVFFDTVQTGFMLIGSVVTVCVVNPWIIIAIPFILGGFMGLRNLYIKSSRQVKRIDSQSRSPIYSHLSETLDGLSSVRAFGAGKQFMNEHIKTQEDNGRAFFTYLAMARWLVSHM
jgi:ATP-binding cassette subfamily C (CFTR/MRP) protein 4